MAQFCALDARGARTDSRLPASKKIDDLNLWEVEPGWDTVTVIHSFRVKSVHQSGKKAEVLVEYQDEGQMAVNEWTDLKKTEVVRFELEYSDRHWRFPDHGDPVLAKAKPRWRITGPVLMPHVSLTWALDRMKKQVDGENDPKEKEKALKILRRLQAIAAAYPAPV